MWKELGSTFLWHRVYKCFEIASFLQEKIELGSWSLCQLLWMHSLKLAQEKNESLGIRLWIIGIRLWIIHCGQQNNSGCALKIIKFSDYAFMNSAPTNAEQLDPKSSWVTVSQKDSESVESFLVYQKFLRSWQT
jgi:hypothetical protein